jgi:23S rRNA (guanosine2251-2'-O)-methyltransferase
MKGLLTKTQTKRLNSSLSSQLKVNKSLIFLLQDVDDEINVGAMFRIADGCGASLVLTGTTPTPPGNALSMLARGLDRSVAWDYALDLAATVDTLRQDGFQIVGVEVAEGAQLYSDFSFGEKVCLILGSEGRGIYKKNLELCDAVVFIPMLGKGPSLNVHVAGAIVGYAALAK